MPSESQIISRIRAKARAKTPAGSSVLIGIGDDAAVIKLGGARDLIACCDLSVEEVHFRTDWAEPRLVGHKALAVTLSDVAAMGGTARFALVSIAIPQATPATFIDEVLGGIFDLAETCGVSIIGGDTSSSPGPLMIDTTAIGDCATGHAVTRASAEVGDTIYITGSIGASALGLSLLERGFRLEEFEQNAASEVTSNMRREALLKHLAPEPRLKLGHAIGEAGLARAMIDVSDGLSTDLWHILEESACGAIIHAEAIPIAECLLSPSGDDLPQGDLLRVALDSGEEYELLFTAGPENRKRVGELASSLDTPITAIGEIVSGRQLRLERDGKLEEIRPSGYEHMI